MQRARIAAALGVALLGLAMLPAGRARAAKLTVELTNAENVTSVGAFVRWDRDGNLRRQVNKDAKIESPEVEAAASNSGKGTWVFNNLAPGSYDLVIMGKQIRIEGFSYPPVLEFDPFFPPSSTFYPLSESADDDTKDIGKFIEDDIHKSQHYENKVEPLYMGRDKKAVRVLVQLIRDKATSYKAGFGTMRHEIWQYDWNYGGWQKNKRTKVLDRIIMEVAILRKWTWVWEPKIGGIQVQNTPLSIKYDIPAPLDTTSKLRGLFPY